jgi:hypothetical protein
MPAKKLVAALTTPNAATNDTVKVRSPIPNSSVASRGSTVRSWPIIPPTRAFTATSSTNWGRFSRNPNRTGRPSDRSVAGSTVVVIR